MSGTDTAFERLAHFDEPPGTTTELRTPRRLPRLRAPGWLDRLAAHRLTARVSWTVCAVCLTASAALVALMLTTGPAPAAPRGTVPRLTPAPSDVPTRARTTRPAPPLAEPSARPTARPTATTARTATPRTTKAAPAAPRAAQPSTTPPATPSPTPTSHEPTPDPPTPTPSTGDGGGGTQPADPKH